MNARDKRIQEIRERHAASTPGEWVATHRHSQCTADDDEQSGLGLEIQGPPEASNRGQFERGADARFIAHAHQDVPFLLAEIERLESVLRQIRDGDTPAADYDMDERAYWVERIAGEALEPDA